LKLIRKHIKTILPVLAVILIGGLILSRVFSPDRDRTPDLRIGSHEAISHIGSFAEVCGRVVETSFMQQVSGSPTFLNFDAPYPDQSFTAIIWGNNRHLWEHPPEQLYADRRVCVTGSIRLHEERPQIIVRSPGRIAIP
jgi:hypothetical protein